MLSSTVEHLNEEIFRALNQINIVFEPRSFRRYMIILNNLPTRYRMYGKDDLQREFANDYANLVRQRISQGRVLGATPYHWRYADWKQQHFGHLLKLRLKDDLLTNITYFRVGQGDYGGWMGGVPNGVRETTGSSWLYAPDRQRTWGYRGAYRLPREISAYAKLHEFGRGGMPKRQVFTPAMESYARGARRRTLGRQYLRRAAAIWHD